MKILNHTKTVNLFTLLFITALVFSSCSNDDDHNHGTEEELITTVTYTLTNSNNVNDVVTMTFDDPDGDGSLQPTYTVSGALMANATYTGVVKLENKTENPAEDITLEVQKEAEEHEFFYSNTAGLTITKTDKDGKGNFLGIQTTVTTGAAGSGTLTVILKHEPKKPNTSIADAGGSTDVEVRFNVSVQ